MYKKDKSKKDKLIFEEQKNANIIFNEISLDTDDLFSKKEYKDINKYSCGDSRNEIIELQYKKSKNAPTENEIVKNKYLLDSPQLLEGHLIADSKSFFLTHEALKKPADFSNGKLINIEDENYQEIIRMWRFNDNLNEIDLSNTIEMDYRKVIDVIEKISKEGKINEAYLDEALKKILESIIFSS